MAQTEKRDVIITLQGGQALHTIQDMQVHMRKLRSEFRKTSDESKRSKIAAEMKKVNGELSKQYALTRASSSGFDKLRGTIMKLGGGLAAMMGFQVLTDQIGNLIRRNAELSDSYADVQKTTGLTNAQVKELDKSFKQLDTRSSRKELLQLARDAGKLGKDTVQEVAKFVEQADKINVALGEDLGDKALVTIGKLSNIFQTDMLKIGSAINEVGASSEASEPALVEFLSRLGGIATTAKLSAPDIIGYGATLDALGLKAEMSTTALNTFFIDFIKNSEEFGRVAGFAEGELAKLIGEEGTNAGFVAFLEKLRETHPEQKQFLEALEQMGIDGARGSQVFLTLANNTEMLRKQQDIANESFEKGTSVMDEFNVKNNNFAANLNRIQKEIGRTFMSSGLVTGIEAMVNSFADYLKQPVSEKLSDERREINSLITRIGLANDNQKLRVKMMQQLIDKYPKYFGHLNAEKSGLEDISKAMRQVNNDYRSRIKLALRQEELQEIEKRGFELTKKQEDALLILESKKRLANKHGARGYEDVKTARENLNAVTAELEANEKKYLEVLGQVTSMQDEATKAEAFVGPPTFDYESYFNQIDGAGKELSEKEKKRIEELAKNTLALTKQLQDAKLEGIDNVEQREKTAARLDFERRQKEIQDLPADEEVKFDLLRQLKRNHEDKISEIELDAEKARIEEKQRLIEQANDSELLTLQLRVDVAEEGSMKKLDAVAELLQKQMEIEIANESLTAEQKTLIQQDYANSLMQLWDDYDATRKAKAEEFNGWEQMTLDEKREVVSGYINDIGNMADEVLGFISGVYDSMLESAKNARDEQLAAVEAQLEAGTISEEKAAAKKQAIQDKYAKKERELKRKQFAIDKTANIIKATMAMAQAINVAMSGGPIIGQVLAGITAGFAAIQVAMIANQPNPYLFGGRTDQIVDSQGNRHNARNIGSFANNYGYYSTPSYGVVAEDGKPELVVPNHVLTNPTYTDAIAQIEGAIYRGSNSTKPFKDGGYTSTSTKASSNTEKTIVTSGHSAEMMQLIDKQNRFLEHLIRNGVIGKWEWRHFTEGVLDQENIEGKHYFDKTDRRPGYKV